MFDLTKSVILFINYQYLTQKLNIKNKFKQCCTHPASAVILHSTNVVIHRSQYLNQIGKILFDLFVSLLLQGLTQLKYRHPIVPFLLFSQARPTSATEQDGEMKAREQSVPSCKAFC